MRAFTVDPDALVPSLRRHVGRQIKDFQKTSPLSDDSVDVSGGMLVVQAATVLSLGATSRLWERMVLGVGTLTRAAVEVVGKERRPVAGASCHLQNDVSRSARARLGFHHVDPQSTGHKEYGTHIFF